ncbi:MAG: SRPBCC family protein [Brachymonas sp.]|nr:SRPBCC family protein [Brachymonas sp.]
MESISTVVPHELVLERTLQASRMAIWRCWTDPALMPIWFCPKPWYVSDVKLDLRAGGASSMVMNGPNGERFPNNGVYLHVEEGKRLVFTDAFTSAWQPSGKAFMVGDIQLSDAPGGGTLYRASARHWSEEARKQHEAMGFHEGWGKAADQLEELAKTL